MSLKSSTEIKILRDGGHILADIVQKLIEASHPGVTTRELDTIARDLITQAGATPAFLGYRGYPAALCTSINEEIVHGLPSDRVLKQGDILKIDLGIIYKKLFTDHARTIIVGESSDIKKKRLLAVTEEALARGIEVAQVGNTTGDIGYAIATYVHGEGLDVVKELVGHGVGYAVHEEPEVPNEGKPSTGEKLVEGLVIAIEPMVVEGTWKITEGPDGFAFITKDKKNAAHFEHTIAITKDGPIILTSHD